MPSRLNVAQLHQDIEGSLARRFVGALSPRVKYAPERIATGIDAVDTALGGGVPVGCVTELVGVESSGRTTIALSLLAATVSEDAAAAWIDVSDAFDPESAALSGVDLQRMLWVRCAELQSAMPADDTQSVSSQKGWSTQQQPVRQVPKGGGSPHPRSEVHGMSEAVASLLQAQPRSAAMHDRKAQRVVGTPGVPNRPLSSFSASPYREEQVPTDRMPTRRSGEQAKAGDAAFSSAANAKPRRSYSLPAPAKGPQLSRAREHGWTAIDKALRATDLLLQAGGFTLLVLDLGGTPPEKTWRIPLSTWFRFRVACERTRTTLVLLTQHSCAKASAEMVAHLSVGDIRTEASVLTGIHFAVEVDGGRIRKTSSNVVPIRKPPQSESGEQWQRQAAWAVRP